MRGWTVPHGALFALLRLAAVETLPRVCFKKNPMVTGIALEYQPDLKRAKVYWGTMAGREGEPGVQYVSWHDTSELERVDAR